MNKLATAWLLLAAATVLAGAQVPPLGTDVAREITPPRVVQPFDPALIARIRAALAERSEEDAKRNE